MNQNSSADGREQNSLGEMKMPGSMIEAGQQPLRGDFKMLFSEVEFSLNYGLNLVDLPAPR
jgi:hypothetical protein